MNSIVPPRTVNGTDTGGGYYLLVREGIELIGDLSQQARQNLWADANSGCWT
jgi:hypothetical protein